MSKIRNWAIEKYAAVQARRNDEEGQGLAEYGLILALVAVAVIAALTFLSDGIDARLREVGNVLSP